MAELEQVGEAGERVAEQVSRLQNVVYTLPYTTESIAEFLTPALGRVDPAAGGTQVVIVTRDAETALTISETILRLTGAAGIEVVPVTTAARTGRLFRSRPVLAVAGTAAELGGLVRASLLKLDSVRWVVLAWVDDIIADGEQSVAALEALLGELGDAGRVIVTRKTTPVVENLIERYARRARKVGLADTEMPQLPEGYEMPIIKSVTVGANAKAPALRRLLDDLDPPSTLIVARDAAAVDTVTTLLRTLGYHEDDRSVRVTHNDFTSEAHTVIFFQPPVTPAELQRIGQSKPAQVAVLVEPGELPWLRELTGGRIAPFNLHGPERRAQDREEAMRQELRTVLARGTPSRELISLSPLLNEFDATEIAAAALSLLDRERAQRRAAEANPATTAKARPAAGGATGGTTRLFMTVGTRDGVKTADLMAAIAGEGGIPGDRVGKIDLRESHALVEIAEADAAGVIERMNGKMIRGRRVVVRGERDREERDRAAGPRADRGDRPDRADRGERPGARGGARGGDRGSAPRGRGGPGGRPSGGRPSGGRGAPGRGGPPRRDRDRS